MYPVRGGYTLSSDTEVMKGLFDISAESDSFFVPQIAMTVTNPPFSVGM
jgi:hypothetical protein